MAIIIALLVCLAVEVTHAIDLECPNTASCACGREGVNVTVCIPDAGVHEEVCASLAKCENCDQGHCSKCPRGLDGPFCSKEINKSRQKRHASNSTRTWHKRLGTSSIINLRKKAQALVDVIESFGTQDGSTALVMHFPDDLDFSMLCGSCTSLDSPKHGSITCLSSNDQQTCTGKCSPGYRFTNTSDEEMVLACDGVQWAPMTSFPACRSLAQEEKSPEEEKGPEEKKGPEKEKSPEEEESSEEEKGPEEEESFEEEKKSCPDPGFIAHGYRRNKDGSDASVRRNFEEGESVVFGCKLEDHDIMLTCKQDGTWSGSKPSCAEPETALAQEEKSPEEEKSSGEEKKSCPDPGFIAHGYRRNKDGSDASVRRNFEEGESVVYGCKSEDHDIILTCKKDGTWSGSKPSCVIPETGSKEIKSCPDPGFIPNGHRRNTDGSDASGRRHFEVGQSVVYGCTPKGHDLKGSPILTCKQDGTWSSSKPSCVKVTTDITPHVYCTYPGDISNGRVFHVTTLSQRSRPSDESYPEGSKLEYSCDYGYSLEGDTTLTCRNNARWSAPPPKCNPDTVDDVYCPNPGHISNGQFAYRPAIRSGRRSPPQPTEGDDTEFPLGARLQYSCHSGYTLVGSTDLVCLESGSWSAETPVCTRALPSDTMYCENLGPIQNGRVRYKPLANTRRRRPGSSLDYELDDYPVGSVLMYSCDEGYRLFGRRSLTCQSTGRWSSRQPVCEPDCGLSLLMETTGRMGNGVNTASGDWPWVVSISLDDHESSPFICGGAVLNPHTVVTAAHCLEGKVPLLLRFGKHHFNVQEDDAQVLTRRSSEIILHPDYSNTTFDSDIGLVLFRHRIRYSTRVQPICLPTRESTFRNIVPGQIGFVGGWGETEMEVPPEKMMLASLPVVSNHVCMQAYRQEQLIITGNMFCAGYEDARQSMCSGDSGSPFVFYGKRTERYTLEGLVSFGVKGQCGVAGKYAVFTKVFRFVQWIRDNWK